MYWTGQLTSCASDAGCQDASRVNVSAAFFLSIEFRRTGFFAISARRVAFGRMSADAATRVTLAQFLSDTRQLGEGVVVGPGDWQRRLEANRRAYLNRLVAEPAFSERFPPTTSAANFVAALYSSAGVLPTDEDSRAAEAAFNVGGDEGRAAALGVVADSVPVTRAEFAPAFVLMEYFSYLRRNPTDAPDADDSGYQFWLRKLDEAGGDFRRAEMVRSFINSPEYRQRFGRP
jgi:hypothetical protein